MAGNIRAEPRKAIFFRTLPYSVVFVSAPTDQKLCILTETGIKNRVSADTYYRNAEGRDALGDEQMGAERF